MTLLSFHSSSSFMKFCWLQKNMSLVKVNLYQTLWFGACWSFQTFCWWWSCLMALGMALFWPKPVQNLSRISIFLHKLTCSHIFSQRNDFFSKKIRSLSENMWICIFHDPFWWKMSKAFSLFALTCNLEGEQGRLRISMKCYLLPFLTFSWNFCKMFQRM